MLTTTDLLAAAKAAQGLPSNYRLARALDVPEKTVQRWNTGRNTPDDENAAKLAALAGLDAGYVLACIAAERAAEGPASAVWKAVADRLHHGAVAALLAFLALFVGGGPDAGAMAATPSPTVNSTSGSLYIM